MAALDMAIKSGIKLVGGKGTSVLRSVTEDGTVVQKAVSKNGVTKVVTFAEGSPMHKLGITDSVFQSRPNSYYESIQFYQKPELVLKHDERGWLASAGGMLFHGGSEKAKSFLEALRELATNGVNISPRRYL